ncbi:MAG TPA: DUF6074 family protein [Xanthobacteraceae bacterium]|nr:DUF6074 family protein [Xanthobacteraceae bacterium]
MTGLPLFDWVPPSRVIVFPAQRRVGRIRRIAAALLSRKSDHTAAIEWGRTVASVSRQLAAVGLSDAAIEEYVTKLREAVEVEMRRQAFGSRLGGGAA